MKVSESGLPYETSGPNDEDFGLILVHGWGCRHSDYDGVLHHLQNDKSLDYRIITLDLPGHGVTPSQVLPTPSIPGFADLLLNLCREISLNKIVLAGHSMGVRVVAETWKQSLTTPLPTVAGVIFIDGSHYALRPSLFAFDNGDPRSANMSEETKAALKAQAFEKMFSPLTPQAFKESTLSNISTMDKDYSALVRDSMIAYDRQEMEKTIGMLGKDEGVKVLNLQSSDIGPDNQRVGMKEGEKSRWMEFLEENVPGVRQLVVPGCAHFPQVDRPELVAGLIGEFVGEVR